MESKPKSKMIAAHKTKFRRVNGVALPSSPRICRGSSDEVRLRSDDCSFTDSHAISWSDVGRLAAMAERMQAIEK